VTNTLAYYTLALIAAKIGFISETCGGKSKVAIQKIKNKSINKAAKPGPVSYIFLQLQLIPYRSKLEH
jgi:hypothetical protein